MVPVPKLGQGSLQPSRLDPSQRLFEFSSRGFPDQPAARSGKLLIEE